jgi:hypothetical protein
MDLQINDSYHPCGALYLRQYHLGPNLHREDGPAFEHFSSTGRRVSASYYLNGDLILKSEYQRRVALLKLTANSILSSEIRL